MNRVLLVLLAPLLLVACFLTRPASVFLGRPCTTNSECGDGLVCSRLVCVVEGENSGEGEGDGREGEGDAAEGEGDVGEGEGDAGEGEGEGDAGEGEGDAGEGEGDAGEGEGEGDAGEGEGEGDVCGPPAGTEGEGSPPTASLTASVSTTLKGRTVELSFTSTDTTCCNLSGFGSVGTSGVRTVLARETTTYSLDCFSAGGPVSSSTTVTVSPCASTCEITVVDQNGVLSCAAGSADDVAFVGATTLEIGALASGAFIEAEVCDPAGAVLHVADSETSDFFGGDVLGDPDGDGSTTGPTCHDAEVYLNGTTLEAFGDDESRLSAPTSLFTIRDAVTAVGCSTISMIENDLLQVLPPTGPRITEHALSLSPGACANGQSAQLDRRWHIGVNSTVVRRTDRLGTGLQHVFICIR